MSEITGIPTPPGESSSALPEEPEVLALYQTASQLLEDGEDVQAVLKLEEALRVAKREHPELLYAMARAKFNRGLVGDARSSAEFAATLCPGRPEIHFLLGRIYESLGSPDRAITQFRTAALASERDPNDSYVTAAWFALGETLESQGFLRAALESYERFDESIWKTHPEHRNAAPVSGFLEAMPRGALERRLKICHELNLSQEALRTARDALAAVPEDAHLQRLVADELLAAGMAAEAMHFAREKLDAPGRSGVELVESPLFSTALTAAVRADALDAWVGEVVAEVVAGDRLGFATEMARRLDQLGQQNAAQRLWAALAGRSGDAEAIWSLASAQREAGALNEALRTLIDYVRQRPEQVDLRFDTLERWLTSLPATGEFLRLVERMAQSPDLDFAAKFVLGAAAAAAEQSELAARLLQAALHDRPGFELARIVWARMLLRGYEWSAALEQADEALKISNRLAAAHFARAEALDGLDRNNEAADAFREAIRYAPNDPAYAYRFGLHCRRTGSSLGAQRYFQQALALDPRRGDAAEDLIDSYVTDAPLKLELAKAVLARVEQSDIPEDALWRMRTTVRFASSAGSSEHVAALEAAFDRNGDDVRSGRKLALALITRGRAPDAVRVAEAVHARVPDDEIATLALAEAYSRVLEYERAIELLRPMTHRYPNRISFLQSLARCYLHDFRLAESREVSTKILALESDETRIHDRRGAIMLTFVLDQNYDDALALLDEWIRAHGESARFAEMRRDLLRHAGRWQELIDSVKPAFDRNPADLAARMTLVADYERAKRFDEAIALLRTAIEDNPSFIEMRIELVSVLISARQYEAALSEIAIIPMRSIPQAIAMRQLRAVCLAETGRTDEAIEVLAEILAERTIAADPQQRSMLRRAMLDVLRRGGKFDRAIELIEKWAADDPPDDAFGLIEKLDYRRMVYAAAERDAEYINAMEQLLDRDIANPDYVVGLKNDLGYSLADAGRELDRSLQMIRDAVAAEPLNSAYLDSLGWVYYKLGDFAEARKYLARCVRMPDGQDPVLYDHLADAEYRLGDHESARRHWEKALELLQDEQSQTTVLRRAALISAVRAKLEALRSGSAPAVAPVGERPR